ncbi:hypothetical protein QFC22_005177 [Naganishia vaughanmartiniae]|uniref:Uncharacterized protein n=1 Tax=Naganishia vaughanmartiniae TaxID=1424756 RepID=A0ACC2WUG5_9TREE|nr:hypothetical protein QFC22_005177 [Naganishia vaughanmartiniae]
MDEEVLKQQVSHMESTTEYHVDHQQPLHEEEPKLHLKTFLVLIATAMLNFAQLYNILALGAFGRNISTQLGDTSNAVWLSQSVAVCTAVLAPIFSRGSDLFGRKYFVVFGCAAGFVGDLIVSRATSMNMAIAGAAISGISYGAQPLAYAIPSEIVQRKYRVAANLFANCAGGVGAVLSLLIGSTLMRNGHDEKFRIAAIYAISALICQAFYSPPRLDTQVGTVSQRLGYMDWIGYGLFGGALTGITIGLTWGKNPYGWGSAHVLAPLLIGVALALALAVHQWKFRRDGVFDRHIFSKSRNPAIALVAIAIEGAAFFCITNYFPTVVGVAFETDLRRVTTMLSIGFFTVFAFSPLVGLYSKRFKDLKVLDAAAFIFFAAFFGCMISVGLGSGLALWFFPILFGLGLTCGLTGIMAAAQFGAPPDAIATVSALVISFRSLGGSIGLAVCTAIYSTKLSHELPAQIASRVLPLGFNPQYLGMLIGGLADHNDALLGSIPGISPAIIGAGVTGLKQAFITATKGVWYFGLAVSLVGAIVCVFIQNLTQEYTVEIDHPVEKLEVNHKEFA